MLSLMGEEILNTWKDPKFISIERHHEESYESMQKVPWCWHPSAAKYSFALLEKAREDFFAKYRPPLLWITYDALKSEPERILAELCDFLQHVPTLQQWQNALTLIKETSDDYCVARKNIE
jgi:hypothetical protein